MSKTFRCHCGGDTSVFDSRASPFGVGIRRRRECVACRERFTTYGMAMDHAPQFFEMVQAIATSGAMIGDKMDELNADIRRVLDMCKVLRELDQSRYGGAAINRQKETI